MKATKAILETIRETLNNSPVCQKAVGELMQRAIEKGFTPEQWEEAKQKLMLTLYYQALLDCPELRAGVMEDVYHLLRGEAQC